MTVAQARQAGVSNGSTSYDTVVVGGGHNNLTAAGYLAKAGQRVLVLEKNAWIGGSYDLTPALGLTAAYYDTKVDNIGGTSNNGKRQLFMIGSTYKLSKRTNLYADIDYSRFKGGLIGTGNAVVTSNQLPLTSAGGQSHLTGVSVGVNNVF